MSLQYVVHKHRHTYVYTHICGWATLQQWTTAAAKTMTDSSTDRQTTDIHTDWTDGRTCRPAQHI